MSVPSPIERAARAMAEHTFDRLGTKWFDPSEREGFVSDSWQDNVAPAHAAIAEYLRAEAEDPRWVGRRAVCLRDLARELERDPGT